MEGQTQITETTEMQESVVERQVFTEGQAEEKPNYLEKFKDKGWTKKVVNEKGEVDVEKALAQIDNLEGLVGKKVLAFDWKNATEEQLTEYFQQIGVKDHTEYAVDGVPEFNQEKVQKLLYKSKLPPVLAKGLVQEYLKFEEESVAELYSEKGFKAELSKNLGEDFKPKADAVVDTLRGILSPDEMTYIENSVPNATIGVMYKAIYSIIDKYGVKETGLSAKTTTGGIDSVLDLENKITESRTRLQRMKNNMGTTPEGYKAELSKYIKLNEQYNKAKERK